MYVLFLLLVKYSPALDREHSSFVARATKKDDDLVSVVCIIVAFLFSEQLFFFFFARCWEVEN